MVEKLFMGKRELERFGAMERVKAGEMTLVEAAVRLGVSYRQTKRNFLGRCPPFTITPV